MSAAEVEGGEGHLTCARNALLNHERALYRERLMCYDAMFLYYIRSVCST